MYRIEKNELYTFDTFIIKAETNIMGPLVIHAT